MSAISAHILDDFSLPLKGLFCCLSSRFPVALGMSLLFSGCINEEPKEKTLAVEYEDVSQPNPLQNFDRPPAVIVPDGIGQLSGQVRNWVSNEYSGDFALDSYGLAPPLSGNVDATGAYDVSVQVAGTFYASTYKEGYLKTYTRVVMPAGDYQTTLYSISQSDSTQWYATYGVVPEEDCGILLVTILGENGLPQSGVTSLKIGGGYTAEGPYFLDELSQPSAGATESSASGRAIFLNVCGIQDGSDVLLSADEGPYLSGLSYAPTFKNAVSFIDVEVVPNGNPLPPDLPPEQVVDFPTEVFPLFQAYNCAACHNAQGTAAATGLYFNETPENVYAYLRDGTSRVNLTDPAASYVVSYPLIADPPNGGHPNGSWTVNDASYQKLLQWIEQGAPYGVDPAPPPVEAVSFDDVYARLQSYNPVNYPNGRGCADCHNADLYKGNLDLTGGTQAVYQRLVDKNLYNLQEVSKSLILRKPYCGPDYCADDPEDPVTHGGGRIFYNTAEADYQIIYQWIEQGAVYDGPPPVVVPTNVNFNDDFQYRLSTRTCTSCHNVTLERGGLNLEGTPYAVCQTVQALVTPNDYANSLFFRKANGEYPANAHGGGKLIADNADPFSLYLRGWIDEGANCDNAILPINFTADVYPLFAGTLNCIGCHGGAAPLGDLALDGGAAAAYASLNAVGAVTPYRPGDSTLITKPFDVYNVAHAENRSIQTYYREYQAILDWVMEGANP